MSNPKQLWEDTQLTHKGYPIQIFINGSSEAKDADCIIYLHWHAHMEIMIVRKGSAVFYIDSHIVEAQAGDAVFVPGGSLHVGYAKGDGEVRVDCIVFNPSLFQEWMTDPLHIELISPYFAGRLNFPPALFQLEQWENEIKRELNEITNELLNKKSGYQLIVKARLYAWLIHLTRVVHSKQPIAVPSEAYFANRDLFKQLIEWVKEHYAEKLTIKQAAKKVGLDPYYFCKQFKKLTGRTFIEYVNVCRVNEAEKRLLNTDESINEIAQYIGCENASYFTKLYKQYKGKTPSEERKSK